MRFLIYAKISQVYAANTCEFGRIVKKSYGIDIYF